MSNDNAKSGNRGMRLLLAASLGVNLLVAGIFAGAHFSGKPERSGAQRDHRSLPLGPYGRAFSKEDRAELRKAFGGRKDWFAKSRSQMRAFGQEMVTAMRAEPFDAGAVEDILNRQGALQTQFQTEGRTLLVDRITAMTADQRAAFAEKLEKGLKRGKRDR